MSPKILAKHARESLAALAKSEVMRAAYLAGGTALALQLGHRHSFDFDFFTQKKFDAKILVQEIQERAPGFRLERQEWGTILGSIQDTRFSLFLYRYPLLFPTHAFQRIQVADIKDIAPMKIAALADRGTKRDFIDLYFIFSKAHTLSPQETLELYDKKFGKLAQNKLHILKSFGYFEDANKDEMPKMIKKVAWREVKKFFRAEQKKLAKTFLGV